MAGCWTNGVSREGEIICKADNLKLDGFLSEMYSKCMYCLLFMDYPQALKINIGGGVGGINFLVTIRAYSRQIGPGKSPILHPSIVRRRKVILCKGQRRFLVSTIPEAEPRAPSALIRYAWDLRPASFHSMGTCATSPR